MRWTRWNEHFAVWLTRHLGSMGFTWASLGVFLGWMVWNSLAPMPWRFDTPPWFPVLLYFLNVGQWLFIGITLVAQNVLNRRSEHQAQQQFVMIQQINDLIGSQRDMMTGQRDMMTTLVDVTQALLPILKDVQQHTVQIEAKTAEIDAEVDALRESEGPHDTRG